MLDAEKYIEQLKCAAFGSVLLEWVKSMLPRQEIEYVRRDKGWTGSLLNYYLMDVSDFYVELKAAKTEKIHFGEDRIKIEKVCGYEFAPLSRSPFLILLYGMMIADSEDNAPHHNRLKKAGKLIEFLEDYNPKETEVLRTIVLYNSMSIPKGAWTEQMIIEEAEAHLHPNIAKALSSEIAQNITINIQEYVANKGDNYGTQIVNKNGGKITQQTTKKRFKRTTHK